jgi:hypothetical protein
LPISMIHLCCLDKKHDARIIGFRLQYPSIFFPGRTQYEEWCVWEAGIHSINLINSINPFSWRSAAAGIAKMKPDCLVVHYWMPFFAPALGSIIRQVKRKIKVPVIGLLHNVEPHEGMRQAKGLAGISLIRVTDLLPCRQRYSRILKSPASVAGTFRFHILFMIFSANLFPVSLPVKISDSIVIRNICFFSGS